MIEFNGIFFYPIEFFTENMMKIIPQPPDLEKVTKVVKKLIFCQISLNYEWNRPSDPSFWRNFGEKILGRDFYSKWLILMDGKGREWKFSDGPGGDDLIFSLKPINPLRGIRVLDGARVISSKATRSRMIGGSPSINNLLIIL